MNALLRAMGWRPSPLTAAVYIATLIAAMLSFAAIATLISAGLGVPSVVVQLVGWAGWLLWLAFLFSRERTRPARRPCPLRYRLAFIREVLPGIGCSFGLLLRPVLEGAIAGEAVDVRAATLAPGLALAGLGIALLATASTTLGLARTFFLHEYVPLPDGITTRGVYRHIRHPLFVGGITTSLGFALCTGSSMGIALALVNVAVLPVYIAAEDRRCMRVIGEPYLAYREAVSAVVPTRRRLQRIASRPWSSFRNHV